MSSFFDIKKRRPKTDHEKYHQCSVTIEISLDVKVCFSLVTWKIKLHSVRPIITEISTSCWLNKENNYLKLMNNSVNNKFNCSGVWAVLAGIIVGRSEFGNWVKGFIKLKFFFRNLVIRWWYLNIFINFLSWLNDLNLFLQFWCFSYFIGWRARPVAEQFLPTKGDSAEDIRWIYCTKMRET